MLITVPLSSIMHYIRCVMNNIQFGRLYISKEEGEFVVPIPDHFSNTVKYYYVAYSDFHNRLDVADFLHVYKLYKDQ